jgi:hypothetical protein
MPNGLGAVVYLGTLPPTYTISVTWQEVGVGAMAHQIAVRVPNM